MKKINVTVNTNAKDNSVIINEVNKYKVNVSISPESGKANKKVIQLLANYFKVKMSQISIIKGLKNKNKVIEIDN